MERHGLSREDRLSSLHIQKLVKFCQTLKSQLLENYSCDRIAGKSLDSLAWLVWILCRIVDGKVNLLGPLLKTFYVGNFKMSIIS